jgi:hypothetical protein
MRWDLFAQGLKKLIANAASPQSLAPEGDPVPDNSIRGAPFGDDGYCEEPIEPYSPDYRNERSESSLHLSS